VPIVTAEAFGSIPTGFCSLLDLRSQPHTEFEYPLKLLSIVVPPIVITEGMRGKIVVYGMLPACAVGQDVVRVPSLAPDCSPTDVAAASRFPQYLVSFCSAEPRTSRAFLASRYNVCPPLGVKLTQSNGKGAGIGEHIVGWHDANSIFTRSYS